MERIDIHCHAVPPGYRQHALDNGHEKPDGMPALPAWSPEAHIALMDKLNITKSILSITSPGTHLGPTQTTSDAVKVTRQTNEELSAICAAHPSRFGFFASLPLPCVAESVAEIDSALDTLGAVGFAVLSNAHGVYLGDEALDPVFAKLNARKAILFIHPTTCNFLSGGRVEAAKPLPTYPRPMMEFMFDETRAVANLLLSGTVARYPDITFIMSHCGCALPSLIDRIGGFASLLSAGKEGDKSEEYRKLLRERFFFDLAGFPFPNQIHGLLRMLGDDGRKRFVYGTDYPFTPEKVVVGLAEQLDQGCEEIFGDDERTAVYSGNARRLLGF
ncbi:amidohydrolase [Apodospora peruviana]|uniref:6-methylsalicylate decarboxylase n=1 Tax=Apodospora peruviana TaxID=516989 RepID=A0AAE0HZS6_9PEZI|nr:amidohydrolase [Apodospora peruviana]